MSSNGIFQATLLGRANRTNIIEASTNLSHWFAVTNLLNAAGTTPFQDAMSSSSAQRFYRAQTLPKP